MSVEGVRRTEQSRHDRRFRDMTLLVERSLTKQRTNPVRSVPRDAYGIVRALNVIRSERRQGVVKMNRVSVTVLRVVQFAMNRHPVRPDYRMGVRRVDGDDGALQQQPHSGNLRRSEQVREREDVQSEPFRLLTDVPSGEFLSHEPAQPQADVTYRNARPVPVLPFVVRVRLLVKLLHRTVLTLHKSD